MSSKSVSKKILSEHKVCDILRRLFWRILKDMFYLKCGFLKMYAVLELNFTTVYILVYRIWGFHSGGYEEYHLLLATCLLAGFCSTYFFYPEDGGDMFLRNVGCNSTDNTASYPRRWYSSCIYNCRGQDTERGRARKVAELKEKREA
jgi:hypothetical protein